MAVVSLNIAGRFYRFSCNDGQEAHMRHLGTLLDQKAKQLTSSMGAMQEGQLLVLIALLLEEDLYTINKRQLLNNVDSSSANTLDKAKILEALGALTKRVKALTESIES